MNNELSRIHSLVDSDGTTHLADYTYLGRDRTVQVDFPQPGVKFTWLWQTGDNPTPPAEPYTGWDHFGRAIDLRWIKNGSGAELERLQHGYDRASNRLYRKNLVAPDADKQDELYTYDGLSQLSVFQRGVLNTGCTAITGTPIAEEDFIFDPTGNWNEYVRKASGTPTTQTRTHNKANELTAIDSSSSLVTEDAAGNMTKVPKPDDWSSAYDLKYDAWNRLVEVRDGSTVVATYAYDGLNRRTKKVMGSDTRHFYYTDKWQIIEERVNASTSADRQFVWGIRYTDDLVLRDKGTERLYVIQDYFQPTAVMDTTGAVLERYGYEAFGTSRVMEPDYTPLTDSAYEWETRFGAYRWDEETKMVQVRNRYLHTQLGRWVTRDLIEYGDGMNLYAYVQNIPNNFIDSTGLLSLFDIIGYAGFLLKPNGSCGCITVNGPVSLVSTTTVGVGLANKVACRVAANLVDGEIKDLLATRLPSATCFQCSNGLSCNVDTKIGPIFIPISPAFPIILNTDRRGNVVAPASAKCIITVVLTGSVTIEGDSGCCPH